MSQVESLDSRPGYIAKRLQQALRTAGDRALQPWGLTMSQYAVLAVLVETPGASNSELARRCFVTRQTMNALVAGLHAAGLISRTAHTEDGRVQRTELTRAGRSAARRGGLVLARIEEQMTKGLSDLQRRRLLQMMRLCVDNLESWKG